MTDRFPQDSSLCEEDKTRLQSNADFVQRDLIPDMVVTILWAQGILTYKEKADIAYAGPEYRKAGMIVDCILRGSQRSYDAFIQALYDDHQGNIADKIIGTPGY